MLRHPGAKRWDPIFSGNAKTKHREQSIRHVLAHFPVLVDLPNYLQHKMERENGLKWTLDKGFLKRVIYTYPHTHTKKKKHTHKRKTVRLSYSSGCVPYSNVQHESEQDRWDMVRPHLPAFFDSPRSFCPAAREMPTSRLDPCQRHAY